MVKTNSKKSFVETIAGIRKKGKEWGMTDTDIDKFIVGILEQEKTLKSRILSATKFALKAWVVFLILVACGSVYLDYHPKLERRLGFQIGKLLFPHLHQIQRVFRKHALPIVQYYNLSAYYDEFCLVYNPIFVDPVADCVVCSKIKSIRDATGRYRQVTLNNMWRPFTVQDNVQDIVSYRHLRSVFEEQAESLKYGTAYTQSNNSAITSIGDLLSSEGMTPDYILDTDKSHHTVWVTRRYAASHILRQLFKRPYFIPDSSEVSLEKRVYIDGPDAAPYQMPTYHLTGNSWYTQGDGTRRVVLTPNIHCKDECTPMEVTMNATNVLYFNNQLWTLTSFPVETEYPEISVSFVATFETVL